MASYQEGSVPSVVIPFTESTTSAGSAQGRISSGPPPQPAAAASGSAANSAASTASGMLYSMLTSVTSNGSNSQQQQAARSSTPSFFSIARYQPLFNVDTADVLSRIKDSLIPFRGDFLEKTSYNPDLYGPFWICTTLVFAAACISNLISFFSRGEEEGWAYDINKMVVGSTIFYGYVFLVPIIFKFLIKYLGADVSIVSLWCLYGYSMFAFIPATLLAVLPSEMTRWIVVLIAWSISSLFLILNARHPLMETNYGKIGFVLLGVAGLQAVLGLILKLYFFNELFTAADSYAPPPAAAPAPTPK